MQESYTFKNGPFLYYPVQFSVYASQYQKSQLTASLSSITHFTDTDGHARYYLSVSKNVWSFGLTTWPTRPHHKREKFRERAWCGPLLLSRLLCRPPTRPHKSPPAHVHPSVYCLSCTHVSLRKTKSRKRFAFWSQGGISRGGWWTGAPLNTVKIGMYTGRVCFKHPNKWPAVMLWWLKRSPKLRRNLPPLSLNPAGPIARIIDYAFRFRLKKLTVEVNMSQKASPWNATVAG